MTSPQVIIMAGMPRAGTTFIYDALAAQPDCFRPYRKEVSFFSSRFDRGEAWYRSLYRGAESHQRWVDISPDYFLDERAPERIARSALQSRVALAIREPASWAVSFHRHISTFEWQPPPFADFMHEYHLPDLRIFPRPKGSSLFSLGDRLIEKRVNAFRHALGSRLLLYDYEFFRRNPLPAMQALEQFWGLRPVWTDETLSRLPINSSQRRHSKWLTYLLSRELLVESAGAMLPHGWLRTLRAKRDQSAVSATVKEADPYFARDLAHARDALKSDAGFVSDLFRSSPMLLGDGTVFNVT